MVTAAEGLFPRVPNGWTAMVLVALIVGITVTLCVLYTVASRYEDKDLERKQARWRLEWDHEHPKTGRFS